MRELGILTLGLLVGSGLCHADGYSIQGASVGAGVSQSSGGAFQLQGVIGKPIALSCKGGSFSLDASQIGYITAVQMPNTPLLSIRAVNGAILLSWTSSDKTYAVEETGAISPAAWQLLSLTATTTNAVTTVSVPSAAGNRFFRLRQQ